MTREMRVQVATPSAALQRTYHNYRYLTQEERDRRRQMIRRERAFKRRCILFSIAICIAFCFAMTIFSFRSNAKTVENRTLSVSYQSVMIERGETLWSIAEEQTAHFPEVHAKDYIKKVTTINGLSGTNIHYGQYLVIPVYHYDN